MELASLDVMSHPSSSANAAPSPCIEVLPPPPPRVVANSVALPEAVPEPKAAEKPQSKPAHHATIVSFRISKPTVGDSGVRVADNGSAGTKAADGDEPAGVSKHAKAAAKPKERLLSELAELRQRFMRRSDCHSDNNGKTGKADNLAAKPASIIKIKDPDMCTSQEHMRDRSTREGAQQPAQTQPADSRSESQAGRQGKSPGRTPQQEQTPHPGGAIAQEGKQEEPQAPWYRSTETLQHPFWVPNIHLPTWMQSPVREAISSLQRVRPSLVQRLDQPALTELSNVSVERGLDLLGQLERHQGHLRNPSAWLCHAIR